jgi:23S rRNA-/tRNA-specific pseudouridylate synthase
VHLASIGCPIVGDGDYGNRAVNRHFRERYGLRRIFLHAGELEIPHPADGTPRTFRAPPPPDLARLLDRLRKE